MGVVVLVLATILVPKSQSSFVLGIVGVPLRLR